MRPSLRLDNWMHEVMWFLFRLYFDCMDRKKSFKSLVMVHMENLKIEYPKLSKTRSFKEKKTREILLYD